MPDFNTISALVIALVLFRSSYRLQDLPPSLQDVASRAKLVNEVNERIGRRINSFLNASYHEDLSCFVDVRS